jgi:hypothetical protein
MKHNMVGCVKAHEVTSSSPTPPSWTYAGVKFSTPREAHAFIREAQCSDVGLATDLQLAATAAMLA